MAYTGRVDKQKRPVGRPRKYPAEIVEKHGGAPKLQVRVSPAVYQWLEEKADTEHGGKVSDWVRNLLAGLYSGQLVVLNVAAAERPPAPTDELPEDHWLKKARKKK